MDQNFLKRIADALDRLSPIPLEILAARLLKPSGGEVTARVQHRHQHVATVVGLVLVEVRSDAGLNFGQRGWRGRHHLHAARTSWPRGRQQRRREQR